MTRRFRESIAEHGPNPVRIEEGRIINVNMKRWTADVRTRESQRTYFDVQWSSPYFHFAGGEGIFFMPEVGAKVKVCRPSDTDPFIMCFVTPFERSARQADETGEVPPSSNPTSTEAEESSSDVTYRAGRPYLQQGDIMLKTRDGNAIWLRRGGVVEIGSTKISKRLYIPILNYIRDICENYSMWTAGGLLSWVVTRSDTNPEDEATAVLTVAARNVAQDEKASALIRIGHVDDTNRLRVVIAPRNIDARTFEVSGDAVYSLDIDQDGNVTEAVKKDVDYTVEGDLTWNITGSATFNHDGDVEHQIGGGLTVDVGGEHSLEASSSTERISGSKTIDCSSIKLGGAGATTPMMLANLAIITFISGHTHPVNGPNTGPPTGAPPPNSYQAQKVRGQ